MGGRWDQKRRAVIRRRAVIWSRPIRPYMGWVWAGSGPAVGALIPAFRLSHPQAVRCQRVGRARRFPRARNSGRRRQGLIPAAAGQGARRVAGGPLSAAAACALSGSRVPCRRRSRDRPAPRASTAIETPPPAPSARAAAAGALAARRMCGRRRMPEAVDATFHSADPARPAPRDQATVSLRCKQCTHSTAVRRCQFN